jgi:hypothetical protein
VWVLELKLLDRAREFYNFIALETCAGVMSGSRLDGNKQCSQSQTREYQLVNQLHDKYLQGL